LKLMSGHSATVDALISDWSADPAPLPSKTMIAGMRSEVRELNDKARALLISAGQVIEAQGIEVEIVHRDESRESKRFAPGDRVVFTKNDKDVGVANGVAGTVVAIERAMFTPLLRVELDDANERGEKVVMVPPSFGRFDHGYCLTNHKSQGRTFNSAYCLVNPAMADREWTYVAASRSRFSTTLYVNRGALVNFDIESHQTPGKDAALEARSALLEKLAFGMSKSRGKETALDWGPAVENDLFASAEVPPSAARARSSAPNPLPAMAQQSPEAALER
jgi:hypothetical protein